MLDHCVSANDVSEAQDDPDDEDATALEEPVYLGEPPTGFSWPTERWAEAAEFGQPDGWISFFRRAWGPVLRAGGKVSRASYKRLDAEGGVEMKAYLARKKELPFGIRFLKGRAATDHDARLAPPGSHKDERYQGTLKSRSWREKQDLIP